MSFDKNKLKITPSSFEIAMNLNDAVLESINKTKIDIGDFGINDINSDDPTQIKINNNMIETLIKLLLTTMSSKKIRECLLECAKRAIYNNEKIDIDFFENDDNRPLYFPIMVEIIKSNLAPFFTGITSALGNDIMGTIKNLQK